MTSRLSRFCEALIEAGWLAALIVVPLFFNIYSARVFEPDKISTLRAITFVMLGAWIVKQVDLLSIRASSARWPAFRNLLRTPLVLPTLLLALAYLISTIFSLAPRISFWGSYQRLQGTLTTLSYMVIFFLMLGHLRRPAQLYRLLYAIILTSVPISLYGIWQRLGQDPLPWGGDVVNRVAANMGNPIFVSAYLIMAFFLTMEQLIEAFARLWNVEGGTIWDAILAGCGLFILAIQVITGIFFSQSRGPFLGWIAGLYVFMLLGLVALGRWALASSHLSAPLQSALRWIWVAPIVLAVFLGGFLILFNLPNSPLAALRQESGLGRLGTILDLNTGTNRVRTLIWEGTTRLIAPHAPLAYPDGTLDRFNVLRPLIGYGPESMWVAFNPFYPPDLAHLEARNASPDRSHNETFDALVTTGLLGFLAYFFLFTSIFYYSLYWLGLIRTVADRNLFLALGAAGALAGVFIPWALDGSLRLMGVGIPFGFIVGVVLYVTVAAFRARQEVAARGVRLGNVISSPGSTLIGREWLIIALLSTIVAHFVEIHFGIAIAATRTYFWALSALLVLVGMGLLQEEPSPTPERALASRPAVSRSRRRRSRREPAPRSSQAGLTSIVPSVWAIAWPYVLMGTLVFVTLAYNYITNSAGDVNAWGVFWGSLTTRYVAAQGQRLSGLGIIWLIAFTWLVGGLLALGKIGRSQQGWIPGQAAWTFGLYSLVGWGIFLLFGLYHAGRLSAQVMPGSDVVARIANHIVTYEVAVLIVLATLAVSLWWQGRWSQEPLFLHNVSPLIAVVIMGFVVLLILNVSINPVRADILYKQGQAHETAGQWANSGALYQLSLSLTPKEDYYYLFLGRAQLEQARQVQDTTLREQLLQQALQTLNKARALNPLNTDHTANLARLYRNWGELITDAAWQEQLWQRSLAFYQEAIRLSPNAAHLHNEWGLVHLLLGDLYQRQGRTEEAQQQFDQALARYEHSLALDQEFLQTYLLLGDLYRTRGELTKAASVYEKALALQPNQPQVWGVLGYLYTQLGRLDDAIAANEQALRYNPGDMASHRNLALLYEQAGRLPDALAQAKLAREVAAEADRPALDQLIAQLESRVNQP